MLNSAVGNSKMTIANGVTITTTGSWGDLGYLPFTIDGPGTLVVTPGKRKISDFDGTASVAFHKVARMAKSYWRYLRETS